MTIKYDPGWSEAAIAWNVCASIHRNYAKGRDPFFNTRQADFIKHLANAQANMVIKKEGKASVSSKGKGVKQRSSVRWPSKKKVSSRVST